MGFDPNELCGNFRAHRAKAGMTQVDLAKRLHVTTQSISNYENGTTTPNLEFLVEFADFFNCSLDSLVGRGPV